LEQLPCSLHRRMMTKARRARKQQSDSRGASKRTAAACRLLRRRTPRRSFAYIVPMRAAAICVIVFGAAFAATPLGSEVVAFPSGTLTLKGVVFKPEGAGPFPAVVYNHGSAAGMLSQQAFDALGPVFVRHRWVFVGPYRRGQGLSAQAGPFIGDEIDKAR